MYTKLEVASSPTPPRVSFWRSRRGKAVCALVALICIIMVSIASVGSVVKQQCSATAISLHSLKLDSLCSTDYNYYETTFKVESSCPCDMLIYDFELVITANNDRVASTQVEGFVVKPGNSLITRSSYFALESDNDLAVAGLRSLIQQVYNGTAVSVRSSASVSGSVLGLPFSDVPFNQEISCMNCGSKHHNHNTITTDNNSNSNNNDNNNNNIAQEDTVLDRNNGWNIHSISSGGPRDDKTLEGSFTVKITALPMKNLIVNIPRITLDVYEGETWVGSITVNPIQFGNGSNLLPLSTLLPKTELANIAMKTLKNMRNTHSSSPPTLEFYGAKNDNECALQQAIAGVRVGEISLSSFGYDDLLPYFGLPSISLEDLPLYGSIAVSVPLFLNIEGFQHLIMPDMQIDFYQSPSKFTFATVSISKFYCTSKSLSFTLSEKTTQAKVLLHFVNTLIFQTPFPIDVVWAAGSYNIFELYSFNTVIYYDAIYEAVQHFGDTFQLEGQAIANTYKGNSFYGGVVTLTPFDYYNDELVTTYYMPLYYKNQYFGEAQILIDTDNRGLQAMAGLLIPVANEYILEDIWTDLRTNKLPPGIKLLAAGDPNYQIGKVIDYVLDYFKYSVDFDSDAVYSWEDVGTARSFDFGTYGSNAYFETTLIAGSGLVRTFKLDDLVILPNAQTLNIALGNGEVEIRTSCSFFSPTLDFSAYVSWNLTSTN